ncbi:MAG: hypothetical protein IJ623_04415 [Bacteroidales bacterium]|nr:hypothetical protein [Bacteroidales bacterium]
MKKQFLILMAAGLFGALACNKSNAPSGAASLPEGPTGLVSLQISSDPVTKVADAAKKDSRINTVQILVFNEQGIKETDRYEKPESYNDTGTYSTSFTTRTGSKTIYAIVNSPRLTETSLAALESHLSDLGENTPESMVMSGKITHSVAEYDKNKNSGAAAEEIGIHVKRLVSMIQLDKICVNFKGTMLENGSFTIQEIYAKNVVGKSPIGVQTAGGQPISLSDTDLANAGYWYNKMTKESNPPAVTYDTFSQSCDTNGAESAVARDLFVYPNNTGGDSDSNSFSPRKTRLVIKAHVRVNAGEFTPAVDEDTYYTFDLPVLQANYIYKISNINISMLGKKDDNSDEKTLAGLIKPVITVDPWNPNVVSLSYEM